MISSDNRIIGCVYQGFTVYIKLTGGIHIPLTAQTSHLRKNTAHYLINLTPKPPKDWSQSVDRRVLVKFNSGCKQIFLQSVWHLNSRWEVVTSSEDVSWSFTIRKNVPSQQSDVMLMLNRCHDCTNRTMINSGHY